MSHINLQNRRYESSLATLKAVLYYKLLPNSETINSEKYCFQLDELKKAVGQKYPEIMNRRRYILSGRCATLCIFDKSTKVVEV